MIWQDINIYTAQDGAVDKLGNREKLDVLIGTRKARYTPWTAEEVQLLGRDLTYTMRKYLVHSEPFDVPINKIGIHGKLYDVTRVERIPSRYILLIEAKGFRDGIVSD